MKLDKKTQDIVYAIDKSGGKATTTEIRRETGLENHAVRYRYSKLEDRGLIETAKDPDATPEGVAPVTVASLTKKGEVEIDKGLTIEQQLTTANVEPSDNADQIRQLEQEVAELQDHVRQLQETINFLGPLVEKHEEKMGEQKSRTSAQ